MNTGTVTGPLERLVGRQTHERNHEPHQQGEWFPYTGFRYKDMYDIELHDGTVREHMRPNANAWFPWNMGAKGKHGGSRVGDEAVARVRLKPDSELDPKWYETGQKRIDHQLHLFGLPPNAALSGHTSTD